jgi:SAM-dependent methyltransferase
MSVVDWMVRFAPAGWRAALKQLLREQIHQATPPLDSDRILGSLYVPVAIVGTSDRVRAWKRARGPGRLAGDPLPVPPPMLRMGYAQDNDKHYLDCGAVTAAKLRQALERHQLGPCGRAPILEWGCASGRVLRHFAPEARAAEVWGVDVDGAHLQWAKENLSPPLRFVTCTAYPHLPFEDATFDFVYGISVFTHIHHLRDTWLMEIRRILAPGGVAIFTIHDEHTWKWLRENIGLRENIALHTLLHTLWQPFLTQTDLENELGDDLYVVQAGDGGAWHQRQVFCRTDWVRQEWGRYMDVLAIEPYFEGYQSAVILRKPVARAGSNGRS